jgi:hypothetical protein
MRVNSPLFGEPTFDEISQSCVLTGAFVVPQRKFAQISQNLQISIFGPVLSSAGAKKTT